MKQTKCISEKCNTMITIDDSFEKLSGCKELGFYVAGRCNKHGKIYKMQCNIFTKLIPKYNKMKIVNKNGRIRKFYHHSDLSNYLWQYDKKEYRKIQKSALT